MSFNVYLFIIFTNDVLISNIEYYDQFILFKFRNGHSNEYSNEWPVVKPVFKLSKLSKMFVFTSSFMFYNLCVFMPLMEGFTLLIPVECGVFIYFRFYFIAIKYAINSFTIVVKIVENFIKRV